MFKGRQPTLMDHAAGVEGKQAPSIRHPPQVRQAKRKAADAAGGSRLLASATLLKYSKQKIEGRQLTLLELKGRCWNGSEAVGAEWEELLGGSALHDASTLKLQLTNKTRSCWEEMLVGAAVRICTAQRCNFQAATDKKTSSCWEDLHCTTLQLSSWDPQKTNDSAAQWGLPGCLDQEGAELWLRRGQGLMGPWSGKHETDMQLRFPTLGRVWGAEFGYQFQWCCDAQPGRDDFGALTVCSRPAGFCTLEGGSGLQSRSGHPDGQVASLLESVTGSSSQYHTGVGVEGLSAKEASTTLGWVWRVLSHLRERESSPHRGGCGEISSFHLRAFSHWGGCGGFALSHLKAFSHRGGCGGLSVS
ncbi:unnamed protein product [Closterium sp. Yama58-4]|nr:unnamed protein product [Closterium sp. Yama58-4]